jgi:hypothetical protein
MAEPHNQLMADMGLCDDSEHPEPPARTPTPLKKAQQPGQPKPLNSSGASLDCPGGPRNLGRYSSQH